MIPLEERLDLLATRLRAGEIEALDGMAEALERDLADAPMDAGALARIREKAGHVAQLLEAAGKGVRAARWRLAEIRAMGEDGGRLVTYDGRGRRSEEGAGGAILQRF